MRKNIWTNLIVLVWLAALVVGCGAAEAAPAAQLAETERPPVPVEVTSPETGNIAEVLSFSGDLQSANELSLVSITSGAVEEVMVAVGDQVRAGDPILQVEDTTYKAQLKQAEAGLTVARTNLLKMENGPREEQIEMAKTGVEAARAQLDSIVTLTEDERTVAAANLAMAEAQLRLVQYEYDKIKWAGQTSQTPQALQLQQATIGYETALAAYNLQANPDEATLRQLRAGIRQAELSLQLAQDPFTEEDFTLARAGVAQAEGVVALAQYQVDNAILRAPFDGYIAEVYITTGSVASPQAPAVKLISKDLEVLLQIPENRITDFYLNQPAALKVSAYPSEDFPALISSIAPAADSTSHTFPVKVSLAGIDGKLRAGMFADISVLLEEKTGVVLVPRSAVTIIDGQEAVYVIAADGETAELRSVTTGLSDADRIEIIDGMAIGEQIVTAGLSNLSDGATVEIVARTE